jgi:hypothetical protein
VVTFKLLGVHGFGLKSTHFAPAHRANAMENANGDVIGNEHSIIAQIAPNLSDV